MFIFFLLFSYVVQSYSCMSKEQQFLRATKSEISFIYALVWNKVNFMKTPEWNIKVLQAIWQFFLFMSNLPLL